MLAPCPPPPVHPCLEDCSWHRHGLPDDTYYSGGLWWNKAATKIHFLMDSVSSTSLFLEVIKCAWIWMNFLGGVNKPDSELAVGKERGSGDQEISWRTWQAGFWGTQHVLERAGLFRVWNVNIFSSFLPGTSFSSQNFLLTLVLVIHTVVVQCGIAWLLVLDNEKAVLMMAGRPCVHYRGIVASRRPGGFGDNSQWQKLVRK